MSELADSDAYHLNKRREAGVRLKEGKRPDESWKPLQAPVEWHEAGETSSGILGIPDLTRFKPDMIYETPM